MVYFENIAHYVEDGGALLVSSGPEFAGPDQRLSHAAGQRAAGPAHRRDRHPGLQAAGDARWAWPIR